MSMIVDQAQALRTMVGQEQSGNAPVIAVTSGKGGVGKSNIAVNLVIQLAQMRRRVVLLDADLGTANADVLCNIFTNNNLAQVVAGRRTLKQALVDGPGGFHLVPGASGLAKIAALSEFERNRLITQMRQLELDVDLIIVDTGAGVSPNVLSFLIGADQQLVVTTPEPTALTDAYAVIKTLSRQRTDLTVGLVVNMVRSAVEAKKVFSRIDAVCRRFLNVVPYYAGHVLHDPQVPISVHRRRPFVLDNPHCHASTCIRQLAQMVENHVGLPGDGLMLRMAAWLTDSPKDVSIKEA